jgi:hypothetical protein
MFGVASKVGAFESVSLKMQMEVSPIMMEMSWGD